MERYIILVPFCSADGAAKISMLYIVGNTRVVEIVGALSSEDGLAFPCCQATPANTAIFLYMKTTI